LRRLLSLPGKRTLELGIRPLVMGIVNITPDSFFGESRRPDPIEAAERAAALVAEGADILDFGAESTRPGSLAVDSDEEKRRLIPAIKELRKISSAILSIDTRHADVARIALDAGADIINDISALDDPVMASVIADAGAGAVLMHMKGNPSNMQENPVYRDCAAEVRDSLLAVVRKALDSGVSPESIILDPGIGFGKLLAHNLDLLERLYLLAESGYPVLVGLSRKRFVGELTGKAVEGRLAGSLGAACAAWAAGADILRVHDVAATRDALLVFDAAGGGKARQENKARRAHGS